MRILLIGATGQIGYSLAKMLPRTGHHITVLVRDKTKNVFPTNCQILESSSFNRQTFRQALIGIDHVIYSAGLPEQYVSDTNVFERVNLDLLKSFMVEIVEAKATALTYISTYEVFQAIDGTIRESNPVACEKGFSPYFQSMIRAYRMATDFSASHGVRLVTIHPAAVYGGLNTSDGVTNYIENLLYKRFWRVPFIFDGRFPVVHADSLAEAIIASMSGEGAYIVSDQMTTLKTIALLLRQHVNSYVPCVAPVEMARQGARLMEWISRITKMRPIMAKGQIDFITQGSEPLPGRISNELSWRPCGLDEGLAKYLETHCAVSKAH